MKITALMALASIVAMAAPSELDDPRVIAAIQRAWHQTRNGLEGNEAGFRLDGTPSEYKVIASPLTNQYARQKLAIVPGVTFALFHVHPAQADPAPSRQDKAIADQYRIKVFTIHASGIFMYDPVTRTTVKLRNGLEWMKPAEMP